MAETTLPVPFAEKITVPFTWDLGSDPSSVGNASSGSVRSPETVS